MTRLRTLTLAAGLMAFAGPAFAVDLGGSVGNVLGNTGGAIGGTGLGTSGLGASDPVRGVLGSGATRLRPRAERRADELSQPSEAEVADALKAAGFADPIVRNARDTAGLPSPDAVPLAAGVLISGATTPLASTDPVLSTQRFAEDQAAGAKKRVETLAGKVGNAE